MGKSVTDEDLKNVLLRPDVPDLENAARERIVSSAVIRYRHAAETAEPEAQKTSGGWLTMTSRPIWAAAAALVLVITVQTLWLPGIGGNGSIASATDSYNASMFGEYQTLFQDDLRAVVARNGDVDIVLGGRESLHENPLVLIRIEDDGHPVYITAYSGQTIEAEIGGKNVTLDILITADQDVVLAADEFMLDRGVFHGPDNFRADAHVLETSL